MRSLILIHLLLLLIGVCPVYGQGANGSPSELGATPSYDEKLKGATALYRNNQLSAAMTAATALIEAEPNRWEGYGLAGAIEKAQNKAQQAKASYQRALKVAPDSVKPQISQAIQQIENPPSGEKNQDENMSVPADSSGPSLDQTLDFIKRKLGAPQQCLDGGNVSYVITFSGCKVEINQSFDLISLNFNQLNQVLKGISVQRTLIGATFTSDAFNLSDLDSNSVVVEKIEGGTCLPHSLILHAMDSQRKISREEQKKTRQANGAYSGDGTADHQMVSETGAFVADKTLAERLQKAFVHAIALCSANQPKDVF